MMMISLMSGHITLVIFTMLVTIVMDLTLMDMFYPPKTQNVANIGVYCLNNEIDDYTELDFSSARSGNIHLLSWNNIKEHSPGPPWKSEQSPFNL